MRINYNSKVIWKSYGIIRTALSNPTIADYAVVLVDTTRSRQDINAEIFHHFVDMHRSDVMLKAEDIFQPYLSMNN